VHHSSTSTYIPNFIQIEETFCGRTDGRTYGRTDGRTFFPSNIIRSTFGSRPNKCGQHVWGHFSYENVFSIQNIQSFYSLSCIYMLQ